MESSVFFQWLLKLGQAIEETDPEAFAALFSEDAVFYEAPFQPPRRGRMAIHMAIEDMAAARDDSRFSHEIIRTEPNIGWAMWATSFTRVGTNDPVRLEGILKASFQDDGTCFEFRQWWHRLEPGQDELMRDFDA